MITSKNYFLCTLLLFFTHFLFAQWVQMGNDIEGETSESYSGNSVSLNYDGSIVAIGASSNDENGFSSGQVRLYQFINTIWVQIGQDINGDEEGDGFGTAVSISLDGSIVAVGAPGNDGNGNGSGLVRIYKNYSGIWQQIGSDINGDGVNGFSGDAISLNSDGSIIAIGAYNKNGVNGINSGQVRVYKNIDGIWEQLGGDINGEEMSDRSGKSVCLSGDGTIVAIGSPYNDGNGSESGQIRIFKYNNDNWEQIGGDIYGESEFYYFGDSLSLNSDGTILIGGAPYNNDNGNQSGQVRVYQYINNIWQQIGADINGDSEGDYFGNSVDINDDGSIIVVGALGFDLDGENYGLTRVFVNTNDEWLQVGFDIYGENEFDGAGVSVASNSNGAKIAIGSPGNGNNGIHSGHVRLFTNPNLEITDFTETKISIYPNPSKGQFVIKNAKTYKVNITDIRGRLIYNKLIKENTLKVNLKNSLKKGVYFINFKFDTQSFTLKHIID